MDTPDSSTRTRALWTALRWLVLGLFSCTALVILLVVIMLVRTATGLAFDPHGYGMIFGTVFAVALTPIALALWLLYRSLRRRGN